MRIVSHYLTKGTLRFYQNKGSARGASSVLVVGPPHAAGRNFITPCYGTPGSACGTLGFAHNEHLLFTPQKFHHNSISANTTPLWKVMPFFDIVVESAIFSSRSSKSIQTGGNAGPQASHVSHEAKRRSRGITHIRSDPNQGTSTRMNRRGSPRMSDAGRVDNPWRN